MSVIIKGMVMPSCCAECRFNESVNHGRHLCMAFLNYIHDQREGRLHTCPLEEIDDEKSLASSATQT